MVLVFISIALAGCMGGPAAEADDSSSAPPARGAHEVPVELTGCTIPEAFAFLDPADARPHVPEDFDLAIDGQGRVPAVLGALVCGADGALAKRGLLAIMVTPRDDALLAEGVQNYFWEPEHHLVERAALTEAFLDVGATPNLVSDVSASAGPTGVAFVIEAEGWRHHASGAPGTLAVGQTAFVFGHFREYAAGDGGYVYLDATFDGAPDATLGMSLAMVETGADTVARQLIGETAWLPLLGSSDLTYTDARVGFVPHPQV